MGAHARRPQMGSPARCSKDSVALAAFEGPSLALSSGRALLTPPAPRQMAQSSWMWGGAYRT